VRQGQFHIYPVETIDQGIEILTGVPAGEPSPDGTYLSGTVNALVSQKLKEYTDTLIKLGKSSEDKENTASVAR
jgi:predicted ATP-dependent protease